MVGRCLTCFGSLVALVLALLGGLVVRYGDLKEAIMEVIVPGLPTEGMVAMAGDGVQFTTCTAIPFLQSVGVLQAPLQCRDEPAMWVLVAPAKGGIVLMSRIIFDAIAHQCGLCMGLSLRRHKTSDSSKQLFWPSQEVQPPRHDSDVLMAAPTMYKWPHYARTQVAPENIKCAVLTREPLSRLRSMHTYAMSDGDFDLRALGKRMKGKPAAEALQLMWEPMGREDFARTNRLLVEGLEEGCSTIRFEGLKKDFNGTLTGLFNAWGIKKGVHEKLLDRARQHDMGSWDRAKVAESAHVSFSKVTPEYMKELERAIQANEEIMGVIRAQRKQLNYDVETGKPL